MDLHLHTPGSSDYQEKQTTYLDILKKAEARGLDMIAFTDHNTVAGYRQMMEEVEQLRLLGKLNRALPAEDERLREYERLLDKITVFPGFEFTATFGFHILGIFPEEKPVREIEHLLLALNVPPESLDEGSATIGAGADVLTVYHTINQAGGLVIAAHANSTNGVAMRGFNFGGQTKIAYTQDMSLHALEVTDLDHRGRRTTANFFSGTKPEYPRRMHCIQGSDAHRLDTDPKRTKNLGVGDRVTEALLPEASLDALLELFQSNDFARTRPRQQRGSEPNFDFIRSAREEGANIVQDFHPSMTVRGGHLYNIIADVCAFANTNGGTLYVGMSGKAAEDIAGIDNPASAVSTLEKEVSKKINPPLEVTVDSHKTADKNVVRILVPRGDDPPYAVEDSKIYIREEGYTNLAVRDEIVNLVKGSIKATAGVAMPSMAEAVSLVPVVEDAAVNAAPPPMAPAAAQQPLNKTGAPQTGVEIVAVEKRNGTDYYTVRDLRNGNTVQNVTEKSARKLWEYAITEYQKLPQDLTRAKSVEWQGDYGLIQKKASGKYERYDLAQKDGKNVRIYFGVTEDGIEGDERWLKLVGLGE
jgi:hypothetical protein